MSLPLGWGNKEYVFIIFFLIVAAGLHFFYAPYPSFWLDESVALNITYFSNAEILNNLLTLQPHPPVYFFILKLWRLAFGDGEFALRFLSFIFFLLTVVAIYFLAKRLFSPEVARFSLIFSSASYFLIWFSHQARPYSMAAFFSAASFFFFLLIVRGFNFKRALGYLAFTVGGLYLNYWAVLLFFTQGVILLILRKRTEFKKIFWTMSAAGFIFLPWLVLHFSRFGGYYISEAIKKADLRVLWETARFFVWGQTFLIIPVIGIAIIMLFRKRQVLKAHGSALIFLLFYLLLPIFSAYLISKFLPIYTPGRREIVIIPAWIILVSYLFAQIRFKYWFYITLLLAVTFVGQVIADSNAMMANYKSNDKQVISDTLARMKDGDTAILSGFSGANFDYYSRRYLRDYPGKKINRIYIPPQVEKVVLELELINELVRDEQKLDALLNQIAPELNKRPAESRIYLFLRNDELKNKLVDFFDKHYVLIEQLIPAIPAMPTYISEIRLYSRP